MISLAVEPDNGETEYYSKRASELQSNVTIRNRSISGTLHHVDGYSLFDGDNAKHHLVLKLTADGGATIETKMTGGATVMKNYVTVSDGYCVYSVTDKDSQKVYVKASKNGKSIENVYDLTGLDLESGVG